MTFKMHVSRCLFGFLLLYAGFVFADGFKSKVITDSPLNIPVADDRFLRITNFTQEGGTQRGFVRVNLSGDSGGVANILTAARIDLSTGINSQKFPEIGNEVVVAGPADVRIAPVTGALLFITYKKETNEGGGSDAASPTPTPIASPTPAGTATPTATPSPTATSIPLP